MTLATLVPQHVQNGNTEIYIRILKHARMSDKVIERIRSFNRKTTMTRNDSHHFNFSSSLACEIQSKRKFDPYGNPIKCTESSTSTNVLATK